MYLGAKRRYINTLSFLSFPFYMEYSEYNFDKTDMLATLTLSLLRRTVGLKLGIHPTPMFTGRVHGP